MLRGIRIVKPMPGAAHAGTVVLDHESRHRRRILLAGSDGPEFLLDLPDVPDIRHGDAILLSSGQLMLVLAADEPLMEAWCGDPLTLARIAWHIGNRHLAAEIGDCWIRLRADHVIAAMIEGLGGEIRYLTGPFDPEPGAYQTRAAAHARAHDHAHADE